MTSHATRVGPFLVSFDDYDAGLFRNYAVPDDGAQPTADDVERLVSAFRDRGRIPRLEYLPAVSPAVEPALLQAGFRPERRLPVMTCAPADACAVPDPPGVDLRLATSGADLLEVAEAQNEAYGQAAATDHDVARLRVTVERGGIVALATDRATGRGVGAGLCAAPYDGVSELAAIGVRVSYRRRGIAAALTSLLTRSCPDHGITTPFLTPAGTAEQRIYETVGYRALADMLHISL